MPEQLQSKDPFASQRIADLGQTSALTATSRTIWVRLGGQGQHVPVTFCPQDKPILLREAIVAALADSAGAVPLNPLALSVRRSGTDSTLALAPELLDSDGRYDIYSVDAGQRPASAPAPYRTAILLRPVANPAALGFFALAGGNFIVASWITQWWGYSFSPQYFFPFVFFFGGVCQVLAAMWCFVARDTLLSVTFSAWGTFLVALCVHFLSQALFIVTPVTPYAHSDFLAFWFLALGVVTTAGGLSSLKRDVVISMIFLTLALGVLLIVIGYLVGGQKGLIKVGAYFVVVHSVLAFYRASLYVIEEAVGRDLRRWALETPFEKRKLAVDPGYGEPGVRHGQ